MKARDIFVVVSILVAGMLYQATMAPAAPNTFAARRPFLAKCLEVAKWVGIGIVLHGDEQPPEEAAPTLYNDAYHQHMIDNRAPLRAMGSDGELVVDHGRGY